AVAAGPPHGHAGPGDLAGHARHCRVALRRRPSSLEIIRSHKLHRRAVAASRERAPLPRSRCRRVSEADGRRLPPCSRPHVRRFPSFRLPVCPPICSSSPALCLSRTRNASPAGPSRCVHAAPSPPWPAPAAATAARPARPVSRQPRSEKSRRKRESEIDCGIGAHHISRSFPAAAAAFFISHIVPRSSHRPLSGLCSCPRTAEPESGDSFQPPVRSFAAPPPDMSTLRARLRHALASLPVISTQSRTR
ncbi:hypothetical protein B0J12DRAFT_750289, partial [Macrophomina phaseolina]